MRQIVNKDLAQLLMQLGFAPARQRKKQADNAEKLIRIINREQEYPFDFVCFKITGFHPKESEKSGLINGDELIEMLQLFIAKLTGQLTEKTQEQKEKVYNIEELAKMMNVSVKTIHRWRKRGLTARKFVFENGTKCLGFLQSSVDEFTKVHPELIKKATKFRRLTEKEKYEIVKKAVAIAERSKMSRYQIIEQIAREKSIVHETVRYIILKYEKDNPDKVIFTKPSGIVGPAESIEIYRLFKQGTNINALMHRFNRSKSSIYRIINMRRAKMLLGKKIEFIESKEFFEDDAQKKILMQIVKDTKPAAAAEDTSKGDKQEGIQESEKMVPLNREYELELFRRYNYLKYLACGLRATLKPAKAAGAVLDKIERYLAQAETVKQTIIEANLPLVAAIAGKHIRRGTGLVDLISEGNLSLMQAVERFDYTRGVRFVTYASWVIAKNYASRAPVEIERADKAPTAALDTVQRDMRMNMSIGVEAIERARRSLVDVIKNELDEREQYIILNHFGLIGTLVKKKKKTLKEIGLELGVSKERVRQIELISLQKLRQSLSMEEFELLTGR